jgi:hypothetical protein
MKRCGECPYFVTESPGETSNVEWYWCRFGWDEEIIPDDPLCRVGRLINACHKQRDRARKLIEDHRSDAWERSLR